METNGVSESTIHEKVAEPLPRSKSEEARALFIGGANCAQSVLGTFAAECGLDQDAAFRLASGFGGGMGRMREVCGAFSALVAIASALKGPSVPHGKEEKDAHYALIQRLAACFKREAGSINCGELLELPINTGAESPVSEPRTAEYYKRRPCADYVALAAFIAERLMRGEFD